MDPVAMLEHRMVYPGVPCAHSDNTIEWTVDWMKVECHQCGAQWQGRPRDIPKPIRWRASVFDKAS